MFYYQASSLEPNLFNNSVEEQERKIVGKTRLFREVGNLQARGGKEPDKKDNVKTKNGQEGKPINASLADNVETESKPALRGLFETKRTDMLMEFSSEQQEEKEGEQQAFQPVESGIFNKDTKKNQFLLAFSDDQNQEEKSHNSEEILQDKNERKEVRSKTELLPERNNKLILDFEDDSQQEGVQQTETGMPASQRMRSLLSSLMNRGREKYYIQPIEEGETLQCVIKREKNSNGVRYHIYDSATLRNFMTIHKLEDGYIFVSKYEALCQGSENPKKETVVGKLVSNFFGTEFNCFLCDYQYRRYSDCAIDEDKNQQIMTIQYETNLFGLKGPRKMTAFIPKTLAKGISSKKRLNELYQSQKKKKLVPTVQKYKNKTPKWNKSIQAYVLNFYGRATVSSIKNFIMIHQNQPDDADARVLFGKYGKELFNLDISYPFNLIQGLSLALSSFDKKLACQ